MGYINIQINKAKGSADTGASDHIERKSIPKNADSARTHLNRELVEFPDGVSDRTEAISHRIRTAGIKRKITPDQVRAIRIVLSGTHEDMTRIQDGGRLDEWCDDNLQWLHRTFGKENTVSAVLHMDEHTPHIHATVVPIVTGKRRKANKEQEDGKCLCRKKANTVRLCADDVLTRDKLVAYHDSYAKAMEKYGLQRGVRGSEARHTTTAQYYRDLKRKTGELEANMRQLQTEQQQAEQQLDEVRQEVKSEKLELAKTEAKAAFVAKVGSLFGGGKLKEFEHRNEDLQKRIQELEEEAIQREEQHSKQIQEMKNAYERQYRKLSEFTDFVKRYFPYVEKLMPTIKFLRDTLNFGDGLIKKLCMFKDVTIKGELYSTEFRQHFKTDGSVCSLIETSDGKFDLKIDGVSHVSWFRRKKYEFMKALGLPKQEQQSKKL
ncbi:MobV family relaxase [uncultured Phocaeicola sp.]|uniref:MobV family relaxase n=1 Tax=uncultured Phocaeicola sp. TaxID=990718 RepID=UPI0025D3085D|nr:MobV family relaxase [uncultured Phocaeicola sp.]